VSLNDDDVSVFKEDVSPLKSPRKRGRPKKTDIEAKKSRALRGRPPGEAARIKEFHARLLATSGEKVINTIIRKALDDNDKDQVACLRMCVDRVLPMSYFEKEKAAGRGGINITISGIGGTTEITEAEPVDSAEDVDYQEEEGWK
jgi:DNA-binding phage protein